MLSTPSRRAVFVDGVLGSGADAALPFLSVYLLILGASATEVGLLSSATGLAGLIALFPATMLARRVRSRRLAVLLGNGPGGRAVLLAIAVVPFVLHGQAAIVVIMLLAAARVLSTSLVQPAWLSLFADVVPAEVRAIFHARRSLVTSVLAITIAPGAAWLMHVLTGLRGVQIVFVACGLVGIIASLCFARVREPARNTANCHVATDYRAVLKDARFRRFVGATWFLHAAATIAGPFMMVYMVRTLGATPAQTGLLATSDAAAAVAGHTITTLLVGRCRSRRLFVAATFLIAAVPVLWLGIREPWQAVLPSFVGGVAWAICHLATFNLLLEYAPPERIPEYAAAQQLGVVAATFLGPLAGSVLVAQVGIRAVFVISTAARLLVVPVFLAQVPPWLRLASLARSARAMPIPLLHE